MANTKTPPIAVTLFGKHPGWADHIDDVPAPEPLLPRFKSVLYTNGIDPNVRRWARQLGPDEADSVHSPALDGSASDERAGVIAYNHRVWWWTPDAVVLAGLTPSTDRQGRGKYPMVVAAQGVGVGDSWLATTAWHALDVLSDALHAESDTDAARRLVAESGDALNTAWAQAVNERPGVAEDQPPLHALYRRWSQTQATDPVQPLTRFIYSVRRVYRTGRAPMPTTGLHMRLPALGPDSPGGGLVWKRAAAHLAGGRTPVLLIAPRDRPWVDLILGDPTPRQLECIRREGLALCTEVAFNIDPEERAAIQAMLPQQAPDPPPESATTQAQVYGGTLPNPPHGVVGPGTRAAEVSMPRKSAAGSRITWLFMTIVLLLGLIVAIIFLMLEVS